MLRKEKFPLLTATLQCNVQDFSQKNIFATFQLLKTFKMEVSIFECSNRPVCYLFGTSGVSFCKDIFHLRLTLELRKAMTPALLAVPSPPSPPRVRTPRTPRVKQFSRVLTCFAHLPLLKKLLYIFH